MAGTLRIVAISDTHTKHDRLTIPDGDVLCHAGDFTNVGALADVERFNTFLGRLPHRHKIVIAGNHDVCFEHSPKEAQRLLTHCTYLQDGAAEVEGVRFYGSPWQPWFYDWAFNLQRGLPLRQKWDLIPAGTDVLITHGPPHGIGDRCEDGRQVGCEELLAAVQRLRPRLHIFGHIHEGAGVTRGEHTTFINASSLDARYRPVHAPVVFDLEV